MMNVFFKDEEIKEDDLYFMCYMIERVARTLHTKNRDVVNAIGYDNNMFFKAEKIIPNSKIMLLHNTKDQINVIKESPHYSAFNINSKK